MQYTIMFIGPRLLPVFLIAAMGAAADGSNLSLTAEPYLTGGLFTRPLLPKEGEDVTITIRAQCTGLDVDPAAGLAILDGTGNTVASATLPLHRVEAMAEASWTWTAGKNGLYTIRVACDPANSLAEEDESDNTAELLLPVTVPGRALHFPWYREAPMLRWATCITSTRREEFERLFERGVLPLNWEYGGMSWSYYNKERAESDPEAELADLEALFYEKYSKGDAPYGYGVDECGGYPKTWKLEASIASMKGLVRAKKERPDRFFAVWNAGGLRPELAALYRQGADLLLLETYIWRALPEELGADDVYQVLLDRIEPAIRSTDMFQPAYGNYCYTLVALDTSERPDRTELGEQEEVIRLIRRRCPEMRGIAYYNGGYGGYGLVRSDETDRQHDAVRANADRLCLEYWIKPCVTLMRQSLWLDQAQAREPALVAAVSNLGAIDSGPVAVEFFMDGKSVGKQKTASVPAGGHRNANRVLFRQPIEASAGPHRFEALITEAPDATVLDASVALIRFLR